MHQNNGMKCSPDRKNYIDFQLDVFWEGMGYVENIQWAFCMKESICESLTNLLAGAESGDCSLLLCQSFVPHQLPNVDRPIVFLLLFLMSNHRYLPSHRVFSP